MIVYLVHVCHSHNYPPVIDNCLGNWECGFLGLCSSFCMKGASGNVYLFSKGILVEIWLAPMLLTITDT